MSTSNSLVEWIGIVGLRTKVSLLVMNLLVSIHWPTWRCTSDYKVLKLHVWLIAYNSSHLLVERVRIMGLLTKSLLWFIMNLFVTIDGTTWGSTSLGEDLKVQVGEVVLHGWLIS